MTEEEKFPVHESIEVLEGITIYKRKVWWNAVLYQRSYVGKPQVAVYLWRKRGDEWKRKNKFIVDKETWKQTKEAVDKLLLRLPEKEVKE